MIFKISINARNGWIEKFSPVNYIQEKQIEKTPNPPKIKIDQKQERIEIFWNPTGKYVDMYL